MEHGATEKAGRELEEGRIDCSNEPKESNGKEVNVAVVELEFIE